MMLYSKLYVQSTDTLMSDGGNKVKESYETYKSVMVEDEGKRLILYLYNSQGQEASTQKGRKQALKYSENCI